MYYAVILSGIPCSSLQQLLPNFKVINLLNEIYDSSTLELSTDLKDHIRAETLVIFDIDGTLIHEQSASKYPALRNLIFSLASKRD